MDSLYRAFWKNKMWDVMQIDYRIPQTVILTDGETDHINVPLENVILMMNTGRTDIAGECVYEGDFIESHLGEKVLDVIMLVKYGTYQSYCPADDCYMDNIGFYVEAEGYPQMPLGPLEEYAMVIGNIHEDLNWVKLAMEKPYTSDDSNCLQRILSENITLSLNKECSNNGNMLILGSSGTGKDFNVKLPNITLADAESEYPGSMVIMDDKGEMLSHTRKMFEDRGYRLKIIDFSLLRDGMDNKIIEKFVNKQLTYDWSSLGTGEVDGKENVKTAVFLINPPFSCSHEHEGTAERICLTILKSLREVFMKNGRLPIPVTFWVEFDSPYFFTDNVLEECNAIMSFRNTNIYFCYSLQCIENLEYFGRQHLRFAIKYLDNLVCLGTCSMRTCEFVSNDCGDDDNGRLYITPEEVRSINRDECLVLIRGEEPVIDKKYDTYNSSFYKEYIKKQEREQINYEE